MLSGTFVVRIRRDERFFGFGCDDLNMNVVLPCEEETMADWEVREALTLFTGELKDFCKNVDCGWRLL